MSTPSTTLESGQEFSSPKLYTENSDKKRKDRDENRETKTKVRKVGDSIKVPCITFFPVDPESFVQPSPCSFGWGIYAQEDLSIEPRENVLVKLGFKMSVANPTSETYFAALEGAPFSNEGFVVSRGIIDPDYTGEVSLIVRSTSDSKITVTSGTRIGTIVLHEFKKPLAVVVEEKEFYSKCVGKAGSKKNNPLSEVGFMSTTPEVFKVPSVATTGSVGYDVFAPRDFEIREGVATNVDLGFKIAYPVECDIVPFIEGKSGNSSRGLMLVRKVLDKCDNASVEMYSTSGTHVLKAGQKIAQIVFMRVSVPTVSVSASAQTEPTERGSGGFGSTGEF